MAEETLAEEQEQEEEETNVDEVKDQRLEEESQRQIRQFMSDHGGNPGSEDAAEEQESKETEEESEPEALADADAEEDESKRSLSKNFVQVAKREREIFRRQQEVKQREQGLKKYEEIEASVKRGDHLAALEKLGGSYELATDQVLGREPQGREQSDLAARVERLETEKASLEAGQKVSDYVNRLKTLEIALETASQYAQNTGKLLGDEQLLGLVENYYSQEAEKLLQHPKFSNRKAPAVAEEKPTSRSVQRSRNRTLSQKTSRSSASKKPDAPLTQDEILERAMGAFNSSQRV